VDCGILDVSSLTLNIGTGCGTASKNRSGRAAASAKSGLAFEVQTSENHNRPGLDTIVMLFITSIETNYVFYLPVA